MRPRRCWTRSSARTPLESSHPYKNFSAVVAAAGRGERAGGGSGTPLKQFRELGGRPLLQWSLDALFEAGCSSAVVVVPKTEQRTARQLLADDRVEVVDGGARRQDSVWNGLRLIATDLVVIHDGARPLVTADLVRRCLDAVGDADGAVPFLSLDETVKQVKDGVVAKTVDRRKLVRVQTPQAFKTEALTRAHQEAREARFEGTDDAQLVERIGGWVVAFEGEHINMKVTYEEDIAVAEALLRARGTS